MSSSSLFECPDCHTWQHVLLAHGKPEYHADPDRLTAFLEENDPDIEAARRHERELLMARFGDVAPPPARLRRYWTGE